MRVIQLSDLHFVEHLGTRQSRFKSRAWLAKSHDSRTLSELGRRLGELDYDVVLVSGDLATDGSSGALRHVRSFIEDEEIPVEELAYVRRLTRARRTMPLRCLNAKRYLVLPGNHDRYSVGPFGQIQSKSFRKAFPEPFGAYPYVYVHEEEGGRGRVVFIVLDSTRVRFSLSGKALAVGEINSDNLQKVTSVVESLRVGRSIECGVTRKSYLGGDADSTVLVVALHHHPVIPEDSRNRESKSTWSAAKEIAKRLFLHRESELTRLSNAAEFRKVCEEAKINVVMFGHQHLCYRLRSSGGTLYSCCPTSTGFSERVPPWETGTVDDQPGFLQYDFGWTDTRYELRSLTLHRWERETFVEKQISLDTVQVVSLD
jgi:3',5'-cyclic AMP phosphodiesterase CpdA